MTREEIIEQLENAIELIKQDGKDWLDDRDIPMLEECIKALSQESCEDEYIKVPKKALKYRTAGMVAYNVEWLKKNFDIERVVICGAQEPCDDAISRQAAIDAMYALCDTGETLKENQWRDNPHIDAITDAIDNLPSVTQKCEKCAMNGSGSKYCDNCGQKSGKWIEHPEIETSTPEYLMFYECSECGNKQCFCKSDIHKKRFCSNCGAKMESEVNNG